MIDINKTIAVSGLSAIGLLGLYLGIHDIAYLVAGALAGMLLPVGVSSIGK